MPGTPIATESDFPFLCDTLEALEPALSPMSAGVLLAYAIIKAMTGRDQLAQAWQALLSLRSICEQAVRLYDETKGHEFVARFHKSPMIYTVGGGLNYTNAYILATCYLTEMQWINACPVEASEFFHGVLEIADKDACFVALLGYGENRPLEERVVKFLNRFTRGTFIIDAADYDMEAVDPQMQNVISTIVTARVIRSLIHRLADARRHPLTTRRYYLKYEY